MTSLEHKEVVVNQREAADLQRYAAPLQPVTRLRVFRPYFRQRTLGQIVKAFGLLSIDELPPFFRNDLVWPAKIGLARDMDAHFGIADDKMVYSKRRAAFRAYFHSFQYHQAVLQCEYRLDLDLEFTTRVLSADRERSMVALRNLKRRTKLVSKETSGTPG